MEEARRINADSDLILVIGATGTQGGAAAQELLAHGRRVRFLTRNAAAPAALRLIERGAEAVFGDLGSPTDLERACRDVAGVFAIPPLDGSGDDSQERYAEHLVQAALHAGVRSFVQTTASNVAFASESDEPLSSVLYKKHKRRVEETVQSAGFAHWTILRPTWIMENFAEPKSAYMYPHLKEGKIVTVIRPDVKLDLVASATIGKFTRVAFEQPARFHEKTIALADETLSMREITDVLNRILEKNIRLISLNLEEAVAAGLDRTMALSHDYLNKTGFQFVDLDALSKYDIPFTSFETWVKAHHAGIVAG
jgi:uncharacterized protein YbjT (DUF2867 family)